MQSNRNHVTVPDPVAQAPLDLIEWGQLKLTQPSARQLVLTPANGWTQSFEYSGAFVPRSLLVVNSTTQVLWIANGGPDPLTGVPVQPLLYSPRLPIAGPNFAFGLDPAVVGQTTTYYAWVYLYPTPD